MVDARTYGCGLMATFVSLIVAWYYCASGNPSPSLPRRLPLPLPRPPRVRD